MITKDEIIKKFRAKLETIDNPKDQIREIVDFSVTYSDFSSELVLPVLEEGQRISKENNFLAGEIICQYNRIFHGLMKGGSTADLDKLADFTVLTGMLEQIKGDSFYYTMGLNLLAYFHWFKGEYEKGFNIIYEALKLEETLEINAYGGNLINKAWNYYALAVFHFDTKDIENAENYYALSKSLFDQTDYDYGKARAANGIASVAILKQEDQKALENIEYSIEIYRNFGHVPGLSRALNDLALLEKKNKNYEQAVDLFEEGIKLRREINHIQGLITSLTELGEIYLFKADFSRALEFLLEAMVLAKKVSTVQKEIRIHKLLSTIYKQSGEIEKALHHFEEFYKLNSELLSDESNNNIKRLQSKYEKEKLEKITEIEKEKNSELQKAYELIEQKNKDISDSINYAQRIQLGILPTKEEINRCFENYFVLYLPKDVVSGDFYWAVNATSSKTGINVSLIAAVDCTGHGVPGAFMSMLGNTLLNQTIANPEVIYPSDVLDFLNKELPQNLKSQGKDLSIRDGMDMAICSFDFKNMDLYFAGANNPCWIIRNKDLLELKGDKQAISAFNDLEKTYFTNKHLKLQKNDLIYLFTDGYADQFGGPRGKKFKCRHLKETLLSIHHLPLSEQKDILEKTFRSWKGDLEQVDDVLVIGIRV